MPVGDAVLCVPRAMEYAVWNGEGTHTRASRFPGMVIP